MVSSKHPMAQHCEILQYMSTRFAGTLALIPISISHSAQAQLQTQHQIGASVMGGGGGRGSHLPEKRRGVMCSWDI